MRSRITDLANRALKAVDLALYRRSSFEELLREHELSRAPSHREGTLPPGAERELVTDNPRLRGLRERYRALRHPAADHTLWTEAYLADELDLRYFRGDNAYVWQYRDRNTEVTHLLTACYLREIDGLGLLDRLGEDELFGVHAFRVSERQLLTRDLLDSVVEISFLERTLGISRVPGLRVLDVGAGYGRLAHRLAAALPDLGEVLCTDAVAESTFLADYYLNFRGVGDRARVVPLDRLEAEIEPDEVDLAINVHSFAECSLGVVRWWIGFLRERRVRRLFVVSLSDPHGERILTRERDGTRLDCVPAITEAGYRLALREPKYLDPFVQRRGVTPAHHFLFELEE